MFCALVETLNLNADEWFASTRSHGPASSDARVRVVECVADLLHLQRALVTEAAESRDHMTR
jgi:hypothetical protein